MRSEFNSNSPKKPLKEGEPLPDKLREPFSGKYAQVIDEGIEKLKKAIELRPDYDDAMAYLNLLDRQKADEVQSADERNKYLADADALIEKVKEIKQKKAEKPTA